MLCGRLRGETTNQKQHVNYQGANTGQSIQTLNFLPPKCKTGEPQGTPKPMGPCPLSSRLVRRGHLLLGLRSLGGPIIQKLEGHRRKSVAVRKPELKP